jgi:general stress protein YciG
MNDIKTKRKCGFASMSSEKLREISSMGGKSVPAEKRSFAQDPDHAALCGQKGGKKADPAKRTFAVNPELASKAGSSMSPEKRREVSRMGAIAMHKKRKESLSNNLGVESAGTNIQNEKKGS